MKLLLLVFAVASSAYAVVATGLILGYRSRGGVVAGAIHVALLVLVALSAFVAFFVDRATSVGVFVVLALVIADVIYRRFLGPRLFAK
jgi:hypothetical protein